MPTRRGDRLKSALGEVADEPLRPADGPGLVGRLQRLCRAARRQLPGLGVGVSVVSQAGDLVNAAASNRASVWFEEMQFAMGEGPCLTAFAYRRPVLVTNLSKAATIWPRYGPAAHGHGMRAVFAFPLQMGEARLGALDVYLERPGPLPARALVRALTYADVATQMLLGGPDPASETATLLIAEGTGFEVYQAQGIVMSKLGVGGAEAMSMMRTHAYAGDRNLEDVADDIIGLRLALEPRVAHSPFMLTR